MIDTGRGGMIDTILGVRDCTNTVIDTGSVVGDRYCTKRVILVGLIDTVLKFSRRVEPQRK